MENLIFRREQGADFSHQPYLSEVARE
ncbi:hypothetical protein F383_27896 [Gossypium arboreum]|uniref:Uncharacterized protein n=1 Tax=Gossypium arboreum TaxID=29729 RepID=A0A0B0MR94_GOSAR|nr:hypothetical protein F383_27896 [Gossypium arboreum]